MMMMMMMYKYTMPPIRQYGHVIREVQELLDEVLEKYHVYISEGQYADGRLSYTVTNCDRIIYPVLAENEPLHAGDELYIYESDFDKYADALEHAIEQMEYNIRNETSE